MTTYIIGTLNGNDTSFIDNIFINANSPEEAKAMVIAICPTKKIIECAVSATQEVPVIHTTSLIKSIVTKLIAKKIQK